ncbi:MAG: ADP-ribosylglycohydrolase family protein [Desulfarculus sp.]|nr:ADP-ribosylglycohydrolase family protein [Desulfarculus sp.]
MTKQPDQDRQGRQNGRPTSQDCFSRLAGAALGTMIGDALGMPVEGWTAQAIAQRHGRLETFLDGRLPAGSYTDDSQMMIAILESLSQKGRLEPQHLAGRFVANFQPWRGYGGRIAGVMARLAAGVPWDQAGTGSFGNGGAMRVGVLGVALAHDPAALRQAALEQCRITHHHRQALAASLAQAWAVGLARRLGREGKTPRQDQVVKEVARLAQDLDPHTAARLRAMPALPRGQEDQARRLLAETYACDVRAAESMPPALGAFLAAESAPQAVVLAVSLGGDTDTLGAMAGALAGAYWGLEAWPGPWLAGLENGQKGKDYALLLCQNLCGQKPVDEPGPDC